MTDAGTKRIHDIKEAITVLRIGLDELANGYRFDDKYGPQKIKQLLAARETAVRELLSLSNSLLHQIKTVP